MKNLSDRVLELLISRKMIRLSNLIEDLGDSPKLTQTEEGSGIAIIYFRKLECRSFRLRRLS